jgi:hypothetical protein
LITTSKNSLATRNATKSDRGILLEKSKSLWMAVRIANEKKSFKISQKQILTII